MDLQQIYKTNPRTAATDAVASPQSNVTLQQMAADYANNPQNQGNEYAGQMNLESGGSLSSGGRISDIGPGSAWNNNYGADQVNSMYDAYLKSQLAGLQGAYEQNLSNSQAARDAIGGTYQQQANDMAVQYERNRRNSNEMAAANGLNTGAGSQQNLALQSVWNRDYGRLRSAEAGDLAEADRGIADLKNQYQIAIQQAAAENDYKRAAALLDEYNNQYNRQLQQAQMLASYGDFSAMATMFGEDAADNMRKAWIGQNPLLAYNTGMIDASQYYKMTGKYAPGHAPESSGGYGGGGRTSSKELTGVDLLRANAQSMLDQGASKAEVNSYLLHAFEGAGATALDVRSLVDELGTTNKGSGKTTR